METSCRASPLPLPRTLQWGYLNTFHFGHIFSSGQNPSVFLLYHPLCPHPCTYNKSTETSKHRSNWCDRGAVSDAQAKPFSILFFGTSNYKLNLLSSPTVLVTLWGTNLQLMSWYFLYAFRITGGDNSYRPMENSESEPTA